LSVFGLGGWNDEQSNLYTGEVNASADGQPLLKIAAGYFAQWPKAPKAPIAASADANAQKDIKAALDVEPELLDQAAGW
jgi:hypothetical protein